MDGFVRLPLQTGATMLRRLLVTAATVTAVAAFEGASIAQQRAHESAWLDPTGAWLVQLTTYWVYFLPVTAGVLMAIVGRARASDCVFEPDQLRIEGGKYDNFRMQWGAIDAERTRMDGEDLRLDVGSGVEIAIATASDSDERRSLDALLGTIQYRRSRQDPPPAAAATESAPQVLVCPTCGAPSVVDDRPAVRCGACGGEVPIEESMRERIRAARALRRDRAKVDGIVDRVVGQPSARRVNGMLAATAAVGVMWTPLPSMLNAIPTVIVSVAITVLLALAAYAIIADRRALVLLTLDFAARSTGRPGEPARCRQCDAPLPPAEGDGIVVGCAYCSAENVLGLDVRSEARVTRSVGMTLEQALAARHRSHRRARLVALGAAAAIVVTVAMYLRGLGG